MFLNTNIATCDLDVLCGVHRGCDSGTVMVITCSIIWSTRGITLAFVLTVGGSPLNIIRYIVKRQDELALM